MWSQNIIPFLIVKFIIDVYLLTTIVKPNLITINNPKEQITPIIF